MSDALLQSAVTRPADEFARKPLTLALMAADGIAVAE